MARRIKALSAIGIILILSLVAPIPVHAADLTVTAANVAKSTGARTATGEAGATITAGQALYIASDGQLELADADVLASAAAVGIALHGASTGQPITYQTGGRITIGATTTVGQVYVVSTTAGGIAPYADLGTGDFPTILGMAPTTATIDIDIDALGVAKP